MEQWVGVATLEEIPVLGARVIQTLDTDIAVFRGTDDQIFAVRDACPHKNGPLSQGIMHDGSVTCPLHNWVISLKDGTAQGADDGSVTVYPVDIKDGTLRIGVTLCEKPETVNATD